MNYTCKECKYFNTESDFKGEVNGQCRINPPEKAAFPMVKSSWWCGKFKPKATIDGFWP